MNAKHLADGSYECSATLHGKDGKVLVVLNTTFGLEPGAAMPLFRKEHNMKVEASGGQFAFLNGHRIIE